MEAMVTKGDGSETDLDEVEGMFPAPAVEAAATPPRNLARRRDDQEFDVVWNGVGPLPGTRDADGLGSTLSGVRFSIGRRR
jgi:hypothetical protein